MTDKKNEELNENELDQVTGGALGRTTNQMEVVNEDELIGSRTRKPSRRMEVVNEDEFSSTRRP